MATERMNDSWSRVKYQIQMIWKDHEFTDDEMKKARGSLTRMVTLIHDKTGEGKAEIMRKLTAFL